MKLPGALPGGLARMGGAGASPLIQILTLVLAAAVAGQLALLVWKLVPGARRKPPPVAALPGGPAPPDTGALLNAHLFGTPAAIPGSGENAPRTRVALVLTGTLAVRDPKEGLAIVGETANAARVYAVGASLPGGVRLHEVYTDRVVLERDGVLETLPLPRQIAGGAQMRVGGVSPAGNATEPPLGDSVQRLIAQGPEIIGEVLRPMPTYANGQLKGFRVYAGRARNKFTRLGLQPGDLVTQINGVPLGDAQKGMEIMRSLGSGGAATVTLERGGQSQQITIDAAQLGALGEGGSPALPGPQPGAVPPPPIPDPQNPE